ncbi:MAG TPA: hypothetical protein VKD91_24305, partial [Pyrinomonadaceae bacterium]|nr:hypothetical protein [Pyrinomonadaceae bacterium]
MPGWLKVLLIVAIVIVLLIVGVVGAGVVWWAKNKDALMGRAKEEMAEGREFGRHSDNQACVDESVSRYKKEPGFGSTISNSFFMRTCLEASQPTPGFCDNVPQPTEFMKSAQWQLEQCRRVDLSKDDYCRQLFQPVQQFCETGKRKSISNQNSNSE